MQGTINFREEMVGLGGMLVAFFWKPVGEEVVGVGSSLKEKNTHFHVRNEEKLCIKNLYDNFCCSINKKFRMEFV